MASEVSASNDAFMVNPLRCPIVLILVLAAMLAFVHVSHRSNGRDASSRELTFGSVKLRKDDAEAVEPSVVRSSVESRVARSRGEIPIMTAITSSAVVDEPIFRRTPREVSVAPVKDAAEPSRSQAFTTSRVATSTGAARHRVVLRRPRVSERMHRVVDGDTLERISERYYGDASRASEIFAANRDLLKLPELLPIGKKLRIPKAED